MPDAVRLDALLAGMARRGVPLASESALFIVREVVDALAAQPIRIAPEYLLLQADGAVGLATGQPEVPAGEVFAGLADTLEGLLVPMPSAAADLVVRIRSGAIGSLASMGPELEALLVPLNRGAARRLLARLVREHLRASAAPAADRTPSPPAADREDDVPGSPPAGDALDTQPDGRALDTQPEGRALDTQPEGRALDTQPEGRALDTQPDAPALEAEPVGASPAGPGEPAATPTRGGRAWPVLLLALLALLLAALYLRSRVRHDPPATRPPVVPVSPAPAPPTPAPPPTGTIRVTADPLDAEVFVLRGHAPFTLPSVVSGSPYDDFVATLEGRAAARARLGTRPAGDAMGARTLLLELPALPAGAPVELAGLPVVPPGVADGGMGPVAVHVQARPEGARVYQWAGRLGPVRIEGLPLREVQEVLVWKPGYRPARVTVLPADWHLEGEARIADVNVALTRAAR